jgi:hypothetical protein
MTKYFCDLCGVEMKYGPLQQTSFYLHKNGKSGPTVVVDLKPNHSHLCQKCAQKVAGEGKPLNMTTKSGE